MIAAALDTEERRRCRPAKQHPHDVAVPGMVSRMLCQLRRKQAMSRGVGEDDVRPFRAAQGSNRPHRISAILTGSIVTHLPPASQQG